MELIGTHLSGTAAADQQWGVGSTVAPLRRVFVRTPATKGDFAAAQWRLPDEVALLREHRGFVGLLESLGCQVEIGEPRDELVDAVYTHDSVIMTPYGAILLRMRKPAREPEPDQIAEDLHRLGVPVLGRLEDEAYADGGDKVWFDERTLAIGHSYRTNAAGIEQIRALLAPHGVEVTAYDLPHFQGPQAVLHLMSLISPLADDLAIVYEPLAPVRLLEFLDRRGIERVSAVDEEIATQGANVLAVRPRVLVIPEGNPRTVAKLRAAGCEVHEFPAANVCVKGDGGPTCLTQPLWRS
jgi:N-dimethylarginine dimethylaminohydrolase